MIDEAVRKLDAAAETHAQDIAHQGTAHARSAGLDAAALTRRAAPSVSATILTLAEEAVAAVVVGARKVSGLRSKVLGSVSNGVVHHSRRPVVVVHPRESAG